MFKIFINYCKWPLSQGIEQKHIINYSKKNILYAFIRYTDLSE